VPESDVDDVAQVVVIAMSRAEKKLVVRPGQTLREARRATLRKIIRFRVRDYRRDKARFYRMKLKLSWSDSAAVEPSVEARVLEKERSTQLHTALERMKDMARCYEVVIMNGLEEMPMREVVAALGIPDGTARGRMLRGKHLLRQTLERWDEDERKKSAA
jgi:RNA polymerase sigma factor (sigma-70 family)